MELSGGKIRSQLKSLDGAARAVLSGVFGRRLPADLILSDFYRTHRHCGSRDRALIGAGVYALLRYWGLVRKWIDPERREKIETGEIQLSEPELGFLLYFGFFCAYPEAPALETLGAEFNIPAPGSPASEPELRAAQLAAACGAELTFSWRDMVPEWVFAAGGEFVNESFCRRLMRRPPLWVRIVSRPESVFEEFRRNNLRFSVPPAFPHCASISNARVNFRVFSTFQAGCFEIQDLASQGIGLVAGARPGERWLDACAGAGGKTLQLAARMEGKGTLVAGDVRKKKLEELRLRARRAGFFNVQTRPHEGRLWRGFSPCDGVLLDAPCSGSGVWRRNPGPVWAAGAEENIGEFRRIQTEILEHFAPAVKPGGVLVYSTCSVFPAENEEPVREFLDRNPEFRLDPVVDPLTGNSTAGTVRLETPESDTMFVARMRKGEA